MKYSELTIKQGLEKGNPKAPFVGVIIKTKAKTIRGYRDAFHREKVAYNWDLEDFEPEFLEDVKNDILVLYKDGVILWMKKEDFIEYTNIFLKGDYSIDDYYVYNKKWIEQYIK